MRAKYVMGNWKMNGTLSTLTSLTQALLDHFPTTVNAQTVLFPPAIYIPWISQLFRHTSIRWGAQNIHPKNSGAFTGELSAEMLKDFNCTFVLVGHSERRHDFHEDVKFVAEKFHQVKEHDMIPVLCVGETLNERQKGLTEQVLESQISAIYKNSTTDFKNCIIAYEPVWAIGTGQTATPEEAESVHVFIRALVANYAPQDAAQLPILYGGSVNQNNAKALFAMPNIDGGLVGGASLQAEQFLEIVKCINC